ncbi:MAG: DUF3800 domain-containing protein [Muribaculaceae bacterium]|nr:DUF3800 domain-containing protein [Muribaculaceae bacterium]
MIHIWLDESDRHGEFYSNFYGGILVPSRYYPEVLARMRGVVAKANINDEIKWQKVNEYHFEKYKLVVDELFDLALEDKLKIRIFFRHNQYSPNRITPEERKADYPMLYYQFIKYAFGLPYADKTDLDSMILYIDEIPLRRSERDEFISHIRALANDPILKKKGLNIPNDGIIEVNSKNHLPLQFMDVILGAICFKLNEKDKLKTEGENKVGKRTLLKLKLYRHINQRIREIYPNFNIGITTPIREKSDSWTQVYRHWSFIPKYHTRDTSRTKRAKK